MEISMLRWTTSLGFNNTYKSDIRMILKIGVDKSSLFVLSASGRKDQNMDSSFSLQSNPWYGEGIVRLANRVAVWRQSEVSIDF